MKIFIHILSHSFMQISLLMTTLFCSCISGINIRMNCDDLAKILNIPNKDIDIFHKNLSTFDSYLENHSKEYTSFVIHNDQNSSLITNDDATLFTPLCQIISKIVLYNLIPCPERATFSRNCTSLLIYCIVSQLNVNLPKLTFVIVYSTLQSQVHTFWDITHSIIQILKY